MVKANSIEQFKILRHIQENFHVEGLSNIELVGSDKVRIEDKDGEIATFSYNAETGQVEVSHMESKPAQTEIEKLLSRDETFRYQLLSRMQSDCDYYLGHGNRYPGCLWAGNEAEHIKIMRLLYQSFPEDRKPEWLSEADINNYEKEMAGQDQELMPVRRSKGR